MCTIVNKNLKSWEDCLPFIEFAYNRSTHSSISYSLFEIVYGFNLLTPMDLIHLPLKAELIKSIHEKARLHIEKKNEQYATQVNKGRKCLIFELRNWVWVHIRKERFPAQRKSKFHPRGNGPFQILEHSNDNAYKVDLLGEYNVTATFNVSDLSPFDASSDSRINPFEERENDVI